MMFKADLLVKHVVHGLWKKWAQQNISAQYTSEELVFVVVFYLHFRFI